MPAFSHKEEMLLNSQEKVVAAERKSSQPPQMQPDHFALCFSSSSMNGENPVRQGLFSIHKNHFFFNECSKQSKSSFETKLKGRTV